MTCRFSLFRAGMELFPYRSIHLQLGDRLRVVGPERAIMRFTAHVGNQSHKLDHPNIISIFVGIALGILAGILPIAIPGIPVPVNRICGWQPTPPIRRA